MTAMVGVYYWTLRRSYGQLLEGATLFHDQAARQQQAIAVNDGIVQCLAAAKLARHLGRDADLAVALDAAMACSQEMIGRLLHDANGGRPQQPGDYVRGRTESVPDR